MEMENHSGIRPALDRVLVKPDQVEEVTEGGIVIPDAVADNHQMAQATGTLISVGPDAFRMSRTEVRNPDNSVKEIRIEGYDPEFSPKPGDRVQFARYGGLVSRGADGDEYRT